MKKRFQTVLNKLYVMVSEPWKQGHCDEKDGCRGESIREQIFGLLMPILNKKG